MKRREVEVSFGGGHISGNGGALLLREAERRTGLLQEVARRLTDVRRRKSVEHSVLDLLRQRVYALALGYADQNDHQQLREDQALQTACGRVRRLAGQSTLNRWENAQDRRALWAVHEALFNDFINAYERAPREVVLDFDATDDAVHGEQVGRFFHGYYDHYCFLPLYVFCGKYPLVAYLRQSKIDPAQHAWAILKLLVQGLRRHWPEVKIIFRGDGHFCRWKMLNWCDRHEVGYIVGLSKNNRLLEAAQPALFQAQAQFEAQQEAQRVYGEFQYAAKTWDRERRVIVRALHDAKGANPRFICTNLKAEAQVLYEQTYCARGEMENRIKEQQLDLFADRTSAHEWWANQFRLLLSTLAYALVHTVRRIALRATHLAQATCATIRLRLLRIGAVIIRNTRRIRLLLSSACPDQELFRQALLRLSG